MKNVIHEEKQAKEEATTANNKSVQTRPESNEKVKEMMVDFLNRYKIDKQNQKLNSSYKTANHKSHKSFQKKI